MTVIVESKEDTISTWVIILFFCLKYCKIFGIIETRTTIVYYHSNYRMKIVHNGARKYITGILEWQPTTIIFI